MDPTAGISYTHPIHRMTETDPVSETLCSLGFLRYRTMDRVQTPVIPSPCKLLFQIIVTDHSGVLKIEKNTCDICCQYLMYLLPYINFDVFLINP
jgi:hypothetical protein